MPPRPPRPAVAPAAVLARAKEYPYDAPSSCYALACGGVLPMVRVAAAAMDCEVLDEGTVRTLGSWARGRGVHRAVGGERRLVVAYGANASAAALSRKLGGCLPSAVVPVARATLVDFEVVYSAHLSPYGAVPATLHHSPGARTAASVLMVTPAECRLLRATEPNYHVGVLDGVDARLERGRALSRVHAFVSRHGALRLDGRPVGVAAVPAEGRQAPPMTEPEVLAAVRDRLAPGADLDQFILENVRDPPTARRRTARLRRGAIPFAHPAWRTLAGDEH